MYVDFNLNRIIYMTHIVETRAVKSSNVWMSPSMMVLQNSLTARNKAVSSWDFNERPKQVIQISLISKNMLMHQR